MRKSERQEAKQEEKGGRQREGQRYKDEVTDRGTREADLVQFVEFYPLLLRAAPTNRTHVQHSVTELYERSPGTEYQSAVCVYLFQGILIMWVRQKCVCVRGCTFFWAT